MTEWKYFKKNKELFILSLPGVIYTFIFAYLPLLFLVVAFKRFRFDLGILGSPWVGLDNFKFFFTSQAAAIITRNTVLYNLTFIVLTTVISVTLAILLNEMTSKWLKIHQTLLFLPYFLSWVVVGYITQAFLDSKSGLINQLFETYGFSPVNWYQEAKYWPFIIILVHLWKHIGFATLVYYGGLMGIDSTYYEAAKIDGASKWQMIKKITIPLLMPLIIILFIVDMGKIFRAEFGLFYFVPNDVSFLYSSTDVIDTYVYRSLRVVGDLGMATAVGLYQSIIGLILVVSTNYIIRKINKDHALW
ncbi:ABC transporter permease [Neobacillus massiliamazoniensis]|nr:ABC transporter permease subunit [Neobacillus massiliamazoniensis]